MNTHPCLNKTETVKGIGHKIFNKNIDEIFCYWIFQNNWSVYENQKHFWRFKRRLLTALKSLNFFFFHISISVITHFLCSHLVFVLQKTLLTTLKTFQLFKLLSCWFKMSSALIVWLFSEQSVRVRFGVGYISRLNETKHHMLAGWMLFCFIVSLFIALPRGEKRKDNFLNGVCV